MLVFGFDAIFGVQLGFEFADQETKNYFPGLVWGVSIDLLIVRLTIYQMKDVT